MGGSNACTVISAQTGQKFLEWFLLIPKQLQYLSLVIPIYTSIIIKGNQIYNSFNMPAHQPNRDVKQVLQQNDQNFQKLEIIADVGFFSVEDLKDYLVAYHQLHPNYLRPGLSKVQVPKPHLHLYKHHAQSWS